VIVSGGCTAAPPAPGGLAAIVNGRTVRLVWDEPDTANGPTVFIIDAGSSAGLANIATITVDGALRSLSVTAPPGTYFVRLRARNACGTSDVSNEIVVIVH
jgi:predicted nicotinamide N-methyase